MDVDALVFSPSGSAVVPDEWWTAFGDDALNSVVSEALSHNFTVRAAFSRLDAAEQVARQANAPFLPAVSGYADARTDTTEDPPTPFELGVQASYEVDLWGRLRAERRADVARREATRADAEAAALAISAVVVRTWFNIAATREQLALLDEQITANEGRATVVEARFLNGVVRQADFLRQQRLLEQTRAERVRRQADLDVLEHQLAVLLGRAPTAEVPSPGALPDLPPLPDAGVPLELVRRRPDVRAAEQSMVAVNADVAAAIADQFPRLNLRAAVASTAEDPSTLLTGWVGSIGAGLVAPLFNGGQRRAEVKRQTALLDAEVADYGAALLTALREVEDALARNTRQGEFVVILDRQVDLAARTADGLQAQYTGGLDVGYLDVLTAQTQAQELRRQQISANLEYLGLRVDLYRALAGGVIPPQEQP